MEQLRLLSIAHHPAVTTALHVAVHASPMIRLDPFSSDVVDVVRARLSGYDALVLDDTPDVGLKERLVRELRRAGCEEAIVVVTTDDVHGARLVLAGATDVLPAAELDARTLVRHVRLARELELGRAADRGLLDLAEQALQARDQLLTFVAHDIKNPLQSIVAAAEQLDHELDGADTRRCVACIRRAVARADRLVRDLLDASLVEAGQLAVFPRALDANALAARALSDAELSATQAGMRMALTASAEPVRVLADVDRTLQALGNLTQNAIEHAHPGGVVEISVAREGDGVVFRVADRGHGLPPEMLAHMFDRYWQASYSRRADAGIGLTIVKAIAEAHGGWIEAHNREGGGAEFTLWLRAGEPVVENLC